MFYEAFRPQLRSSEKYLEKKPSYKFIIYIALGITLSYSMFENILEKRNKTLYFEPQIKIYAK